MKILITGCAGFIGSNLSLKLLNLNYEIYGVDNLNNYYDIKLKKYNLEKLLKFKNFNFFKSSFENVLNNIDKIDMVIHLAALAGVRKSMEKPSEYFDNNILKTIKFLEQIKEKNIKKIIFASSSSVYGNLEINEFNENINLNYENIVSYYALSKKHLEEIFNLYSRINKCNIIGFRFFTVYGPSCRPDMAINKFLTNINDEKKIYVYGDGNTSRDYTYIDDITDGIINGILNIEQFNFEIFNLGNNNTIKLNNMIEICENIVGKKAIKEYVKIPLGDVNFTNSNNDKANKLLNYNPKTKLKDGLKITYKWLIEYKNN